jgi:hypothetical protein
MLAAPPAFATPITLTQAVDFSSPSQAFWGPGQSAANFGIDTFLLGNSSFGLRFETGASTGTVSSNYNGAVSVSYNDDATMGLVPLTVGYQGDVNGGHFQTALGAFVKATAYFPVIGDVTITNPDYFLDASRTYTPSPPDTVSDSDSFTPASTSIGPSFPGGSAQAGIDYDIVQNATHTISGLNGLAVATNQASGNVRSAGFSLGSSATIMMNLDEPGVWDVKLTNLALANSFSTDFDLAVVPFIQYAVGFGCGDFGTDSDNGFFCASDERLDTTLTHFDLFSNTPFALALTSTNPLSSFQITVQDSSVPEPGTLGVLAFGLSALAFKRRWRRDSRGRIFQRPR